MFVFQGASRIAEPAVSEGGRFTVQGVAQAPCCLDAQAPGRMRREIQEIQEIDADQLERGLPSVRRRV